VEAAEILKALAKIVLRGCRQRRPVGVRPADLPRQTWHICQYGTIGLHHVRFPLARAGLPVFLVTLLFVGGATAGQGEAEPPLRVGDIRFDIQNIYSAQEIQEVPAGLGLLRQLMNTLHVDTRQYVLRRELLFAPGDTLSPGRLYETERNLRELGFLNHVHVTPTDTLPLGLVDVLVQARETWTLRTEVSYSRASGGDQRWNLSLADANFLGHGLQVGVSVGETEDYPFVQLSFHQRRFLGTPWEIEFGHSDLGDGYADWGLLQRPFYAQDDPFSFISSFRREQADRRFYLSNAGPAGDDPGRGSSLHVSIPVGRAEADLAALLRVSPPGRRRIWRLGLGVRVQDLDFDLGSSALELSDGRFLAPEILRAPGSAIRREEPFLVSPYLVAATEGRSWVKARYLLEYGTTEDVPLDPTFGLKVGPMLALNSLDAAGGSRTAVELEASDWSRLAGGHLLTRLDGQASIGKPSESCQAIDLTAGWILRQGSPQRPYLTRVFGEIAWGDRLLGSEAFVLGLNRGLRTLEFDGMAGDRLMRWNVEEGVVLPVELLGFYRTGLAAFYDGGLAWWNGEDHGGEDIRHEIGLGLRLGATRAARGEIARLDVTWPLGAGGGPVLTAVTKGLF
jgi:hypothetical protein